MRRQPTREADPAFADWLGHRLHETYDPVTREPLSTELMALIRQLDQIASDRGAVNI